LTAASFNVAVLIFGVFYDFFFFLTLLDTLAQRFISKKMIASNFYSPLHVLAATMPSSHGDCGILFSNPLFLNSSQSLFLPIEISIVDFPEL